MGTILAVLAVVGGVDTRPRLGGQVHHETYELGTIARITPKGKIHVQFNGNKLRVCRLTELTAVSKQCSERCFFPSCCYFSQVHIYIHTSYTHKIHNMKLIIFPSQ